MCDIFNSRLSSIVLVIKLIMNEYIWIDDTAMHELIENMNPGGPKVNRNRDVEVEVEEGSNNNKTPYNSTSCQKKMEMEEGDEGNKKHRMPPASVMTRLILIMVWRKLIRNPNTYSSLFGLVWSLISFRYDLTSVRYK